MVDVAVIGAGLAGLTCAGQLDRAGYNTVVLEKSRGVGGRLATRRVAGTRADLGAPYLQEEGRLSSLLLRVLGNRRVLQPWTETVWQWNPDGSPQPEPPQPRYIAPSGMNAVGKFLAAGLEIWFDRRVCDVTLTKNHTWHLRLDAPRGSGDLPLELTAKAIVVAIPAPQALPLLEPLRVSELTQKVRSVEYDPGFAVIAGYAPEKSEQLAEDRPWRAIRFPHHDALSWLGLDSSKRSPSSQPIFVLHSSAEFARTNLESTDLEAVGQQLLDQAASLFLPEFATPEFLQVHRWRYAFSRQSYPQDCLTVRLSLPLVCCGDWCGLNRIETALRSGLAAASALNSQLQNRSLFSAIDLFEAIADNKLIADVYSVGRHE
ncbi:MAG TPA: FAD-dependent oxidoreductase [Oscillatoriales cyanobacterium M59_W2019_021]|nr:FAD-dependent oxidoreductase [Oscillatoriales cyanobacterium M4454_W2019_049]HIK52064.1 FAD-dependent oxidoreductase [Oscillatoriales cyanobacterium M59_W2019_021]